MSRILMIDGDASYRTSLQRALEREGHRVLVAEDGEQGMAAFLEQNPDLIILELVLVDIDGLDVCRRIRKASGVPIVIVSSRADEVDRIVGLELGADDYVTKPVGVKEVVARAHAQLRRAGRLLKDVSDDRLTAAGITVDLVRHEASVSGQVLRLKPREFELLTFLMRNPGRTFSRGQLLKSIWGYESAGQTRTIDVHVGRLRQKIDLAGGRSASIVTVRGVGYRFSA
jgi:two-component system response regulator RegX3